LVWLPFEGEWWCMCMWLMSVPTVELSKAPSVKPAWSKAPGLPPHPA